MNTSNLPHNHNNTDIEFLNDAPEFETFQSAADVLKILGDANRIRIFWILCHCEECVSNLSAITDMSSPAVSHHLKLLKSYDLVTRRREGKEMYYTAAKSPTVELLHHTIEDMISISCPVK